MSRGAALHEADRVAIATRVAARSRLRPRGVTLVEVLLVITLVAVVTGVTLLGSGAAKGARLKRSAVMIASAIRIAYAHTTVIAKPVRLVFDFNTRAVSIEQADDNLFSVRKNDPSGGASPATEAERKAVEEADSILQGPRAPRPNFTPTKAVGFATDKDKTQGKPLETEIRFLSIETEHNDKPVLAGREYLYFFPGGQTERAAIQLSIGGSELVDDTMTVLVSPLTGRADLRKGRLLMPRPRDDDDASERQDPGP